MDRTCRQCGADVGQLLDNSSKYCIYCGGKLENPAQGEVDRSGQERQERQEGEKASHPPEAQWAVPALLGKEGVEQKLYAYLAAGNYTPDDLVSTASIVSIEISHVPAHLLQVDYTAEWSASFGYDRQEAYTAYRKITRNGKEEEEPYTAYRTVTDWKPASGVDYGDISMACYAGRALVESPLKAWQIVTLFPAPENLPGMRCNVADVTPSEKFLMSEKQAEEALDASVDRDIDANVKQRHRQGDRQTDWNWTARKKCQTTPFYFPLAYVVYEYKGKQYHFWADGINGETVLADTLPADQRRKNSVRLGFLPFFLALPGFFIGLSYWSVRWYAVVALLWTGLYGLMRRGAILGYSKQQREKQLLQREASNIAVVSLSPEDQKKYAAAFENVPPPFYARTHNDRFVIPVMTLIFFGLTLLPPPEALTPARKTAQAVTTSTEPDSSAQPVAAPQEKPVSAPAERHFPDTPGKRLEVGTESLNGHNGHSGATQ